MEGQQPLNAVAGIARGPEFLHVPVYDFGGERLSVRCGPRLCGASLSTGSKKLYCRSRLDV
jgi:hypothetical protein